MKWNPPTQPIPRLALGDIEFGSRGSADYEDEESCRSPRKETLLKRALDLARGEPSNEEAISDIVYNALAAKLYNLAVEAVYAFSEDSNDLLCGSIAWIFRPKNWAHFPQGFSDYCAERLLKATEDRSRSSALGFLGLYYLSRNDQQKAFQLWQAADYGHDIDEAIAETCTAIVAVNPEHSETALVLSDLICTRTVKAKAISEMTAYL